MIKVENKNGIIVIAGLDTHLHYSGDLLASIENSAISISRINDNAKVVINTQHTQYQDFDGNSLGDNNTDVVDALNTIFNETPLSKQKFYIQNSGRVYCYTDLRWISLHDDLYGSSYYQFSESAGTSTNPVVEWEHNGIILEAGTTIKDLIFGGRFNSLTGLMTDLEISVQLKKPTNASEWLSGISADAELDKTEIYRGLLFNPTDLVDTLTGSINEKMMKALPINHTLTERSELSIYVKPVGTNIATQYYYANYTWVLE